LGISILLEEKRDPWQIKMACNVSTIGDDTKNGKTNKETGNRRGNRQ